MKPKDKQLLRIQRLHLFTDGTDTVVAFDEDDAIKVWQEWTGDKWDETYDAYERIEDRKIYEIHSEPDDFDAMKKDRPIFSRIITGKSMPAISAPAWAWALQNGRGFICSTEW